MDIQKIHQYKSTFDAIAKEIKDDEGNAIEVWYARELQQVLGRNIFQRGVDDKGFGRIRSKGDQALFGGLTTEQMKLRLGIKSGALADRLPTLTIAAKNLATEMTNYNVEQKDLQGEMSITAEHVQNNRSVRGMLGQRGIKPEELPPAEDIKKVERRVAKDEKDMQKDKQKLPKGNRCQRKSHSS